jgi:hypothetical protein
LLLLSAVMFLRSLLPEATNLCTTNYLCYHTLIRIQAFLRAHVPQMEREMVTYSYRAGQPMIIDARTLHSVSPNVSEKWRVVVWFIFDSY